MIINLVFLMLTLRPLLCIPSFNIFNLSYALVQSVNNNSKIVCKQGILRDPIAKLDA